VHPQKGLLRCGPKAQIKKQDRLKERRIGPKKSGGVLQTVGGCRGPPFTAQNHGQNKWSFLVPLG